MAWRQPGNKPLSEPMMIILLKHICITQPQWVNTTITCENILSILSFMNKNVNMCTLNLSSQCRKAKLAYISSAETRILCSNYKFDTMVADALVPCVTRPSAAMILIVYDVSPSSKRNDFKYFYPFTFDNWQQPSIHLCFLRKIHQECVVWLSIPKSVNGLVLSRTKQLPEINWSLIHQSRVIHVCITTVGHHWLR